MTHTNSTKFDNTRFDFLNDGRNPLLQIYINNQFYKAGYLVGWNGQEYIFDSRNGSFTLPSDLTDYSFAMTNPHTM